MVETSNSAQMAVPDEIRELFEGAMGRSLSEAFISEAEANALVQQRLQMLGDFRGNSLPPDIDEAFSDAFRLTNGLHRVAEGFLGTSRLVSPLGKLAENDLFGIALLEQQDPNEPGNMADIRLESYQAIMEKVEGQDGLSFQEIVARRFAERSQSDQVAAALTATFLVARQSTLSNAKHAMLAVAEIGLICLLYRSGARSGFPIGQRRCKEGVC